MANPRIQLADDMLRRFAAAVRSGQLYSKAHPIVSQNVRALTVSIEQYLRTDPSLVIGIVGDEIVVGDTPIAKGDGHQGFVRRLRQAGIERVTIDRGATPDEVIGFVMTINTLDPRTGDATAFANLPHIRVGRVSVDPKTDSPLEAMDMAAFRRMYDDAVSAADIVWNSAQKEKQVDATVARSMVNGLAQAVSQNRTALLALTTLKNYDNYTFTHMVNVSILTMGQARALGIDGPLLREFGLAALMHDIGKVRTPLEVLNKPGKLTDQELAIMQQHPVDGAEILRATPDLPALAPIVAFEHHRRLDGTGYPRIERSSLNLGTMLCAISDVYDAMRSQRSYQQAFPSDRILAVLEQKEGRQFDQHLIRRFVQLIGIYPAGNLVRTDTGHLAVVRQVHAPDPYRPLVRVVTDPAGTRLERPYDVHLWERQAREGEPGAIVAPVDPATVGIDPLTLM